MQPVEARTQVPEDQGGPWASERWRWLPGLGDRCRDRTCHPGGFCGLVHAPRKEDPGSRGD